MRVVIMGCGRVGALLATNLAQEGHQVTIIDTSTEGLRQLPERAGLEAIQGDGTVAEELRRAGIEEANLFVAVARGDNENAMAAQIARHLFKVKKVVCRINDPVRYEMYRQLGLEVISPTRLVYRLVLEAVKGAEE